MNSGDKASLYETMSQQMSSSPSQFHFQNSSIAPSPNSQDELIARRKLEQKRRFQQKQGNACKDVDSFMQSMFSDLQVQPKNSGLNTTETAKVSTQISELVKGPGNCHSQSPTNYQPASGAADWSKIACDEELTKIFNQEDTEHIPTTHGEYASTVSHSNEQPPLSFTEFIYPSWCLQPVVFLPLVYQQVFEASCVADVIQTSILYPILLLSGLRQDQLSQIWSQVNLKQPGTLVKEELFMALALIALTQNSNGQVFSNDCLYHLTDIPVPYFQIQQQQQQESQPSVLSPPSPPTTLQTSSYQQEDFADFTSFASFEQIEENNGAGHVGFVAELAENHLCPSDLKLTSFETQSITSLDLPMPSINVSNQDNASQRGTSDAVSYSSFNHIESPVTAADTQSISSFNVSEPYKLELTQFSFFSDDTSQIDSHLAVWQRCFEKCYAILCEANNIFSSIESPTLCMEVLQQLRTRDYVHHLHEVFHVHKRIYTAAVLEPTTTSQLLTLWKQIIVSWTNLLSFFSTAHLHLLNDEDIDYSALLFGEADSYCSICLLSTVNFETVLPTSVSLNTAHLTFAGRLYHAPCANFYLNLIDGILPSLRRSP